MTTTVKTKKGYVNGSDMLVKLAGKATGHATEHTLNIQNETKERAVKPEAKKPLKKSLHKMKTVVGQTATITSKNLAFYDESEHSLKSVVALAMLGEEVDVECFERESDTTPYLKGKFIITQLEIGMPAQDDTTYNITLENAGDFEYDEDGLTQNTPAAEEAGS